MSHTVTLSAKQQRAAALLAAGRTVTETAQAVKVRRETVSRWRSNPGFAGAVDLLRERAAADAEKHLTAAYGDAAARLARAVREDEGTHGDRMALALLRLLRKDRSNPAADGEGQGTNYDPGEVQRYLLEGVEAVRRKRIALGTTPEGFAAHVVRERGPDYALQLSEALRIAANGDDSK